ncbi:hypothetical protein ACQ4T2_24780, partial [Escherichia coli]
AGLSDDSEPVAEEKAAKGSVLSQLIDIISGIFTPFIGVMAATGLLKGLLALAVTSTQAMQRKLGRRWQLLHNFVYLVVILAPIHYLWSVKIVSPQPVIYARL